MEQNERSAYRWFLKASQLLPQARYFLGLQYAYGRGTKVDYGMAKNYLTFAMDAGIKEASAELDRCKTMQATLADAKESGQATTTVVVEAAPVSMKAITEQKEMSVGSIDIDVNIPKRSATNENTFVMVICNENYKDLADVPYALRDGEIFAKYCQQTLGIPEKHIKVTKDATYGGMIKAVDQIDRIAKAYGPNTINIIAYYAGHGAPDDASKDAYLIPVDAYNVNSKFCYSLKDFFADLSKMQAKKVMVFLDACFSGSARAGNGEMLASARGVAISSKKETLSGNMVVLSATNGSETALPYEEQKHGMFTYFLLKKIQESKGNVSMRDLSEYVKTQVSRQSVVTNDKAQTPTLNISSTALGWENWMLDK